MYLMQYNLLNITRIYDINDNRIENEICNYR